MPAVSNIEVINPATEKRVGSVRLTPLSDVEPVVAAARKAQRKWNQMSPADRRRIFSTLHDLVLDRSSEILDTIQGETGKSRRDAFAEPVTIAGTLRYYLYHGSRFLHDQRRRAAIPLLTRSTLHYRPHGVVGLIVPWNYPFLLSLDDAIPALLAGNAVVVKPSELTPLSAQLAKDLLSEAGLDPDLFGIVNGGPEVGQQLISHVDSVGFTGSTRTGRVVAVAAAQRLIPFFLELGGKNPMIVLKDAPLESAARALAAGAFSNTGQTCISVERVYVETPVFDRFAELVAVEAGKLKVGFSNSWDLDMGSLIHRRHAEDVRQKVSRALLSGARTLTDASAGEKLGPAFVPPAVLVDVDPQSEIDATEIFGPVVTLHPVAGRSEAIALANDSEYGLNASVWAGDTASGMGVAKELDSGTVGINSTLMVYNAFDLPMGGVKRSGLGRRHGPEGILRYVQPQSVVSSFAAGGGYDSVLGRITDEQTANRILRLLRLWRKIPGLR
jgi:succinate-semialdehyde dehydrogenase/glutarate-semialdehyde dehydrogenase